MGQPTQYRDPNTGQMREVQAPDWAQAYASQYGSQLQSQIGSGVSKQIDDLLKSGGALKVDESGLMRVGGGRNRYGEIRPDYHLMQSEFGELDPRFQETMGPSFKAMQDKALTEGDTEAARLAREQQGIMSQRARDLAIAQNQSGLASARGNLAARGGLRSGAAERLEGQGAQGLMRVGQDIAGRDAAANVGISMQDEAMKNQMLGQTGQAEQMLGASNMARLEADIARMNTQQASLYSEDMAAFGAQKTADAQAAASCFLAGTPVELPGNRVIKIEDLDLGMITELGGEVYLVSKSKVDHYYNYCGVSVTGSHAVLEDGVWLRIKDSKLAVPVYKEAVVYCPATKEHRLKIKDMVFSDLHEHDEYDHHTEERLLEMLNEEETE